MVILDKFNPHGICTKGLSSFSVSYNRIISFEIQNFRFVQLEKLDLLALLSTLY